MTITRWIKWSYLKLKQMLIESACINQRWYKICKCPYIVHSRGQLDFLAKQMGVYIINKTWSWKYGNDNDNGNGCDEWILLCIGKSNTMWHVSCAAWMGAMVLSYGVVAFCFHFFSVATFFFLHVLWVWEIVHRFHRLLCRLLDSPFVVFCVVDCDVVDVVAAVAVAVDAAASALFGRFRRIFNTWPRVQFPARLAPLLTCCKIRLNNAVTSNIDILNTVNFWGRLGNDDDDNDDDGNIVSLSVC